MSEKARPFIDRHQDTLQQATVVAFLLLVGLCASLTGASGTGLAEGSVWLLIVAAAVGAYMAMNIGANDVANNMGPAVGSGAITMGWAILVAAVFEALGAIVAGGDVVGTIKGGIIDPAAINDPTQFAWVMFSALLAGALWLNLATALGAPVSTTHSIIGAVMGAGIAAGGWGLVNWPTITLGRAAELCARCQRRRQRHGRHHHGHRGLAAGHPQACPGPDERFRGFP